MFKFKFQQERVFILKKVVLAQNMKTVFKEAKVKQKSSTEEEKQRSKSLCLLFNVNVMWIHGHLHTPTLSNSTHYIIL